MDTCSDLKNYLGSKEPLQDRLEYAKKHFSEHIEDSLFAKEDTIILWLTRLLTTKGLVLKPEELEDSWKTCRDILSSSHFQAIYEKGWVCLLSSSFIETLVSMVTTSEETPRCYAVRIVYVLLKNTRLAPLVTHQPSQCLVLLGGVIEWIVEGRRSDEDVVLATMLTEEVNSHLKLNTCIDKKSNLVSIMDSVFMLQTRMQFALKSESRDNVQKLLQDLKSLVYQNLFNEELEQLYRHALSLLFSEETKVTLPEGVNKIFSCLVTVIRNEDVEFSAHLFRELHTSFIMAYKNSSDLCYQMLMVFLFVIDITLINRKLISPNKNNIACQEIHASECKPEKQEALLLSLLLSVKDTHLHHEADLKKIAPCGLLRNLGLFLVKNGLRTDSGVQCLQILLKIYPRSIIQLIMSHFCIIVCKSFDYMKSDEGVPEESLVSAVDDLLCDVLQVHSQLQEVPNMVVGILRNLLQSRRRLPVFTVAPESPHIYEGNLLFPPRFMFKALKEFSNLWHTNVVATWKVLLELHTEKFAKLMEPLASDDNLKKVSIAVWMLSCLLRAFPIMEMVSIPVIRETVAELMVQTAKEVIRPLITSMLTLPHNNDICGNVLLLCHTWGELQINLCSYNKYVECANVSPIQVPESSQQATDFSYLMPFISPDIWAQISARVANFGNQPTQLALVQLVLQKLSYVVQHHQDTFDVQCNEESMSPTRQTIETTTRYLLNAVEVWGESVMQLFTVHLPYLIHVIHDVHLPTIAMYLVTGFKEDKQYWVDYIRSEHFLEARRLHPHILSSICSTLASGFGSRKRKLSESDLDIAPGKNYVKKLYTKLADMETPSSKAVSGGSKVEKSIAYVPKECGVIFGKLIDVKSKNLKSLGCVRDIGIMRKLIRGFPFTFISIRDKTVVMFVLLSAVVNDEFDSREEQLEVLQTITVLVSYLKSLYMVNVIDMDIFAKWLIQKRMVMPLCVHSPRMISSTKGTVLSTSRQSLEQVNQEKSSQTFDTLISQEFDLLIVSILEKTKIEEEKNTLQNLVDYVTTSEELPANMEARLHIAVLLLRVCQNRMSTSKKVPKRQNKVSTAKKVPKRQNKMSTSKEVSEPQSLKNENELCKSAFKSLSSWILNFLKKTDMATIQPSTAASLLIAHAIIIAGNARNVNKVKSTIASRDASEKNANAEEDADPKVTPSKTKTPKCLKHLKHSMKLGELCLSSSNSQLVEYALHFFHKTGEYPSLQESLKTSDIFSVMWSALSCQDHLLASEEFKEAYQSCLLSVLPLASEEAFNQLLTSLVRNLQNQTNIVQSLKLWQIVMKSKRTKEKTVVLSTAVEHFIPLIVNLLTLQNPEKPESDLQIMLLQTLQITLKCELILSPHTRGLVLKLCTITPLQTQSLEHFQKIFKMLVDVMTCMLVQQSGFAMEQIPSILVVVEQLSEALIAQSAQEHNHREKEIKELVACSNSLERLVSSLLSHRNELKRVIHFTIARIVVSLHSKVIYQDIKAVLEIVLYQLLDLCDQYCFDNLLVTLPLKNTKLLKHLHKKFREFYRYRS